MHGRTDKIPRRKYIYLKNQRTTQFPTRVLTKTFSVLHKLSPCLGWRVNLPNFNNFLVKMKYDSLTIHTRCTFC